nr:EOG090X09QT [Eulimnadia texana]
MSKAKKVIDEARETKNPELDLADKGLVSFDEMPGLLNMYNLTRITLAHNKISEVPPAIANLSNLEILNLFNNNIEELPTSLSSMTKLRILNLGMNKLSALPRGFGAFPVLEVLDLTYNNLSENSLPGNFFMLETLRALYLGDNDFQTLPAGIGQLKNLQILVLRDNDLIELPKEIGDLVRLRELHIQGNRLSVLPPEIGNLDLSSNKSVLKMENNPWVAPIADQLQVGVSHVIEYIRSETYRLTEKNASQWSKDLLTSLLKGLEIEESGQGKCTIHEIDKIDGEAVANNRKAKLIFFYEWTIDLKWKGSVEGSTKVIEGSIHIPNLSEENSPEEIDIDVSVSSSSDNGDKLKQMLRTTGAKVIRQQLAKYIKSLREDFTQGMILPSKTQEEQRKNNINNGTDKSRLAENTSSANRDMQRLNLGSRIETKTLTASEIFKCPAVELYNALTLPELVQAFTNGPVNLEVTKGGSLVSSAVM